MALNEPAVVENNTDTPGSGLFEPSITSADTVTVPPLCDTLDGLALTDIAPAAAAPIRTSTPPELALPDPVRAGPEKAWMKPVPEMLPARNVAVAMPLTVGASMGLVVPIEGWNVTIVPLCTAVPDDSVTIARTVAWPLSGKTFRSMESVMVDPVGDVSGTVSQAITASTVAAATNDNRIVVFIAARTHRPWTAEVARERNAVNCCTEEPDNDNRLMELAGQPFDFAHGRTHRGYAMAALLVGMSVMAVLMSALLPVWTTMAKREKEAELMFRGNQYARAVGLFQRKFANAAPPTIDVLVEQRFLRKKYKDPITNDDFQPIYANQTMMPGGPGGPQQQAGQQRGTPPAPGRQLIQPGFGATGATAAGGIIGVTSKSKETSLKVFNGRTRYNEWAFVHVQTSQQPGQPGGGGPAGFPGGPNQRPGPGGQQGPSPFGMPPGSFPNPNQPSNPNQRQGMPMQPPGFGPNRPPVPGGSPFGTPQGSPFSVPPQQTRPGQRPPGQ